MANPLNDVSAAILAGGLGTRLRSVVADRPKVLAPVLGKPFLGFLLQQLARAGIREAVLLVGYGAEQIREELGDRHFGVDIDYSVEKQQLGTGGAVQEALPFLRRQTLLLMNGDSYCDVDIGAMVNRHVTLRRKASVALTRVENSSRFGSVILDDKDRIVRLDEKAANSGPCWINAGVYLFDRDLVERIALKPPISLERDLFPDWISRHSVFGFRGGRFIDIGVPESYRLADTFFQGVGSV